MKYAGIIVDRIYRNENDVVIRTDRIKMTGHVVRDKAFILGERPLKRHPVTNHWVHDYGDEVFHSSNGRQVLTTLYIKTAEPRVVVSIEMIGRWLALDPSANRTYFTWRYGTVDCSDLPQIGALV